MPTPKDVIVTIVVDTEKINKDNVKQTIVLSDDNGGANQTPDDSCTFLSKINDRAQVAFKIRSKNGTIPVEFVSFLKVGSGPSVMKAMPEAPNWTTTVSGNQKDKENYEFTIKVQGKGQFTLDPGVEVEGP